MLHTKHIILILDSWGNVVVVVVVLTCMKIRGSVVSYSFIFPHPPEDKKKKKNYHINSHICQARSHRTGSSHSGVEEYPTEKTQQHKNKSGTCIYIIAGVAINTT